MMRLFVLLLVGCGASANWPHIEAGRTVTPIAEARGKRGDPDALRALGRIGGEQAVEILRGALVTGGETSKIAAVEGLWFAGASEAAVDVSRVYGGGPELRRAVLRALAAIGRVEEGIVIENALTEPESTVRAAAARAFGVWARRKLSVPPSAREALRKLAGDAEVRYAQAFAIAFQPDGDEEILAKMTADPDAEVRAMAYRGLGTRSAGANSVWTRGLADASPWVRVEAVRGLTGAKSTLAQRDIVATFLTKNPSLSHATLEAVMRLQKYSADPAVRTAFEVVHSTTDDPTVRCWAAAGRVRTGAPLSLVETCGGAEWLRAGLVADVVNDGHGNPDDKLRLWRNFTESDDPRLRIAAVAIGVKLRDHAIATSVIDHALDDPSPAVVAAALERLDAADPSVIDTVIERTNAELAKPDGDPELLTTLLDELAKRKPPAARPAVEKALSAPNAAVRASARAAWTAIANVEAPEVRAVSPLPADPPSKAKRLRVETNRGTFHVELLPGAAPWNVAHIAALARRKFYDGTVCHRVVADFVVQCGDPTGTGSGGSGVAIPAEPSEGRYLRGTVGIADAGKDTGDSQWFVMHSPAPHLEGRYTIIGQVPVAEQAAVDALVVGDQIVRVTVE